MENSILKKHKLHALACLRTQVGIVIIDGLRASFLNVLHFCQALVISGTKLGNESFFVSHVQSHEVEEKDSFAFDVGVNFALQTEMVRHYFVYISFYLVLVLHVCKFIHKYSLALMSPQ